MAANRLKPRGIPRRGPLALFAQPQEIHRGDVQAILDELVDDSGVVVWKLARAVDLRVQSASDDPSRPFPRGSLDRWTEEVDALVAPPAGFQVVRPLFREVSRERGSDRSVLAALCLRVAEWAESRGVLATASVFAQGAAIALPGSARPSQLVARLLKRRGAYARAELWLQRAIALAADDRQVATQCWSELGTVFTLRGVLRSAEASHLRALRVARRFHLRQHVGVALHDLFLTAVQADDPARAQKYASQATEAYYPGHPRLPAFANDVAYFWMVQGEFSAALRGFLAVLPQITDPRDRLLVAANIARAAGGAGDADTFAAYWGETIEGLRGLEVASAQAWAFLDLARGAASLSEWGLAEEAARESVARAERFGENKTLFEAESVLDSVRRRSRVRAATGAEPIQLTDAARLVDRLEQCLSEGVPAH